MAGDSDKLWELMLESEDAAACRIELETIRTGNDSLVLPETLTKDGQGQQGTSDATNESSDLYVLIREMSIPQKIKLAMFGNKAARGILIRDRNKMVPLFVLQNPRLGEDEIVELARNTNLDELVFRAIANNSTWMKNYSVKVNLVSNARVPIDVSLRWVKYLHDAELRMLAKSKNIPQVIASQCRKLVEKRRS